MKANKLIILITVTAILVIVAIITSQQNTLTPTSNKTVLFSDLSDKINFLSEISIQSGSNIFNISRQGEG